MIWQSVIDKKRHSSGNNDSNGEKEESKESDYYG
jgi:hypothetical protein